MKRIWVIAGGVIVLPLTAIGLVQLLSDGKPPATEFDRPSLNAPKTSLKEMVTGLEAPTAIVSTGATGDKRLFVLERDGRIRLIDESGKLQDEPVLDITGKVLSKDEMGLLGLTFHPKFSENGFLYVNYIDKEQHTIIARYHIDSSLKGEVGSEQVLIKLKQPYPNHNGGDLRFGPDGYLYIALGDGGSAGDPGDRAQRKDNFFGKILRIDVDNSSPYGIPNDNPFVSEPGAMKEIWAYGLRNPWRMSFDRQTNELYIADVGQNVIEEVNLQPPQQGGVNYGWRCFEGTRAFKTGGCKDFGAYAAPIFEYNHDEDRCSITGGFVYRGSLYPAMAGKYFYGDFCNGQLFYAEKVGEKWNQTLAQQTPYQISTFGEGSDGELYLADFGSGTIYRLEDSAN